MWFNIITSRRNYIKSAAVAKDIEIKEINKIDNEENKKIKIHRSI